MANYLQMAKRQQVQALLLLGWSYRRIQAETGVRRETISRYDAERTAKAANVFAGSDDVVEGGAEAADAADPSNAAKVFPGSTARDAPVRPLHAIGKRSPKSSMPA